MFEAPKFESPKKDPATTKGREGVMKRMRKVINPLLVGATLAGSTGVAHAGEQSTQMPQVSNPEVVQKSQLAIPMGATTAFVEKFVTGMSGSAEVKKVESYKRTHPMDSVMLELNEYLPVNQISIDQVKERAMKSSLVILGENHKDPRHQRRELEFMQAMHEHNPNLVLATEMATMDDEGILQEYLTQDESGMTPEQKKHEYIKFRLAQKRMPDFESDYAKGGQNYGDAVYNEWIAGYPLLAFAKEHKIPVLSLEPITAMQDYRDQEHAEYDTFGADRDVIMAHRLASQVAEGKQVLALVGASHVRGIQASLGLVGGKPDQALYITQDWPTHVEMDGKLTATAEMAVHPGIYQAPNPHEIIIQNRDALVE